MAVNFLLLSGALSAYAQSPPHRNPSDPPAVQQPTTSTSDSPKIDPQKEADLRRLLKLTGGETVAMHALRRAEQQMAWVVGPSGLSGAAAARMAVLTGQKLCSLKVPRSHLLDPLVPIYAKTFSDSEIKELIQFYETPLGKKFSGVLATMTEQAQAVGAEMGAKMADEAIAQVLASHPKLARELKEARKAARRH